MYVGFAYGGQSRELADAVCRDQEFEPLARFSTNESGRQSHEAYISCLLRWGYIHWDPHARKGQQQVRWAPTPEHCSTPLSDKAVASLYHGEQKK